MWMIGWIAAVIALEAPQESLPWTVSAMMETQSISDVQLSPDHKKALVVVRKATSDDFLTTIYKVPVNEEGEAIPFSSPLFSSIQPKWSPDGNWVAFISKRENVYQLYLIRFDGGEAIPLTKGSKNVQNFSWSPDGKQIAFVMEEEIEPTDSGYEYLRNTSVNRLWIVDPFSSKPNLQPITSTALCVMGAGDFGTFVPQFDWSPDGKTIAFAYTQGFELESFYLEGNIAIVDLATKEVTHLEKTSSRSAHPRYSPDGKKIAYLIQSSPYLFSVSWQVALHSLEDKRAYPLAKTPNGGPFLAGPSLVGWTREGTHLVFFEPHKTKNHLIFLPIGGEAAKEWETGDFFFSQPALSQDGSLLSFIGQSPTMAPEAYISSLDTFNPVKISSFNHSLLAYEMPKTEIVSWSSSDGLSIEGLLTYPTHYEEGKQYPLLLVIHGGPMGVFQESFIGLTYPYPLAVFAEEGFFILRPNPRGSTGYGPEFRYANYRDWGGKDFSDLMTGVDAMIARGYADSARLGVMGWSYGGYMTAWTITQTARFKAASMGAGVSNLVSMAATSDLHHFLGDYFGDFFSQRKLYEERSPLNHVLNVSTPCLIQHGINDKRVPLSQSLEFYHALAAAGQKPTLILYPNTGHSFSSVKTQVDSMQRNLKWFKQYLQMDQGEHACPQTSAALHCFPEENDAER